MEFNTVSELVKLIGFPGVIFAIWWMSHNTQQKQAEETLNLFKGVLDNQQNQLTGMKDQVDLLSKMVDMQAKREERQTEVFTQLIESTRRSADRNFDLIKEMMEGQQFLGAVITRAEEAIKNNQFCPVMRKGAEHGN